MNVGGAAGLRVTRTGYSEIDFGAWKPAGEGRRSSGKFNREVEVCSFTLLVFRGFRDDCLFLIDVAS